ncbi:hypothetical protein [Acetobacter thailandicus]|uniref:Uncharacterized protein n=1 Tax=Acetobacter thailandicus TaxID=1502842 RepID=A0ABT3QB48_9PROT|nr:hypothetical protein [Acetobacter thailandicus]MCX2562512.1 hypothetical protein [Acetobacter thailandicus]NHN94579.1 hypothetical protein [Acetobacter thailandicus]
MMVQSVLEKYRWLATSPVRFASVEVLDSEHFSVDGKVVEKAALPPEACGSNPGSLRTLNFLADRWKFIQLQLFNPLIYYAAFGDDIVFDTLELSLRSLLDIGQYQGDIAVFTNSAGVARLEQMKRELPLTGDFSIEVLDDCHSEVDFYLSRFRFYDRAFFQSRQPLLYLDVDILCNKPVESLLVDLAFSPAIHVAPEGRLNEGNDNSSGHWYGWRMMEADGMGFDRHQRGFSSGSIGYGNSSVACEYARLIMQVAQAYRKETGQDRPFIGYDQCLANYIFLKANIRRFELIGQAVTLHRIKENNLALFPSERRGFIHFLAVPFPIKFEAMKIYNQDMRKKIQEESL